MGTTTGSTESFEWTDQETVQTGKVVLGAGIVWSLYLLIKRTQDIFPWLPPLGLVVTGITILLQERQKRIAETSESIQTQLDDLDPVARAQVLKYLGDAEVERLSG